MNTPFNIYFFQVLHSNLIKLHAYKEVTKENSHVCNYFNPLTPGAFCKKMRFLDILVVFRLDLSQISVNLVESAFCNTPAWLSCH